MKKLLFLGLAIALTGCATKIDESKYSSSQAIYKVNEVAFPTSTLSIDQQLQIAGNDKSGYVTADLTPSRKEIVEKFPAQNPNEFDFNLVFDNGYLRRVGQALAWGADLEVRTSGFLKDEYKKPLSITGKFQFDSANFINGAVIENGMINMVSASAVGFQVTPNASAAAGGLAVGLIGGLISGAIISHAVEQTIDGFIKSKSFAERLEHSSGMAAHQIHIPSFHPQSEVLTSNIKRYRIAPDIYKFVFTKAADTNIDYTRNVYIATAMAVYRGKKFEEQYPKTKGWDFTITNLNKIAVPSKATAHEEILKNFKDALTKSEISL